MAAIDANTLRIDQGGALTPELLAQLIDPLEIETQARGFAYAPEPVSWFARPPGADPNDAETVVAGLLAERLWGWLYVKLLAVHAAWRGRGVGARLMGQAEAHARQAACVGVWVDTYAFQAPRFYEGLGYQRFGTLENPTPEKERIFFAKRLTGAGSDALGGGEA